MRPRVSEIQGNGQVGRISRPAAKLMPECPFRGTMVHCKGPGTREGQVNFALVGVREVVNRSGPREPGPFAQASSQSRKGDGYLGEGANV